MADSMALPTWSAQLASSRPFSLSSARPSLLEVMISMRSDSIHRFATLEQVGRDDNTVLGSRGRAEAVLYFLDEQERNLRRRFTSQNPRRDCCRRDAAVVKIPGNSHECARLGLSGCKAHQWQPRA